MARDSVQAELIICRPSGTWEASRSCAVNQPAGSPMFSAMLLVTRAQHHCFWQTCPGKTDWELTGDRVGARKE